MFTIYEQYLTLETAEDWEQGIYIHRMGDFGFIDGAITRLLNRESVLSFVIPFKKQRYKNELYQGTRPVLAISESFTIGHRLFLSAT